MNVEDATELGPVVLLCLVLFYIVERQSVIIYKSPRYAILVATPLLQHIPQTPRHSTMTLTVREAQKFSRHQHEASRRRPSPRVQALACGMQDVASTPPIVGVL